MKKFVLYRTYLPNGTRGIWYDDQGKVLMRTIEPAHDHLDHPCIQEGTYICERFNSPKHGNVFQLQNVPGRTGIEIHIVENTDHTVDYVRSGFLLGCIGPGLYDCVEHDEPAVGGSHEAFRRYNDCLITEKSFMLQITSKSKEVVMDPLQGKDMLMSKAFWGWLLPVFNQVLNHFHLQLPTDDGTLTAFVNGAGAMLFVLGHMTRTQPITSVAGIKLSRLNPPA